VSVADDALPAHSVLGASGTHRWFHCQASVKHTANSPERASSFAEEGTAAHDAAKEWLLTGVSPMMPDLEQLDAVRTYVDFVNKIRRRDPDALFYVERAFRLEEIEDDIPMFGTSDAVIYSKKRRHLHIIDYKHGVGIPVGVYWNTQLLYYALGVWYLMNRRGVRKLTLTIVQPRAYHPDGVIRSWDLTLEELLEFEGELLAAVERVRRHPDRYEPGEWCQFCPVAGACKAHYRWVMSKEINKMEDPGLFSADELAKVLRKSKPLAIWLKRVQEEGLARAEAGKVPKGMKLVGGKKVRIWKDEQEAYDRLKELIDEDETPIAQVKVISPAQVEKLIGKRRMEEVNDLIEHTQGKPQLVDQTDGRDAIGSSLDYAMKGI
jgi:hypothetical protein